MEANGNNVVSIEIVDNDSSDSSIDTVLVRILRQDMIGRAFGKEGSFRGHECYISLKSAIYPASYTDIRSCYKNANVPAHYSTCSVYLRGSGSSRAVNKFIPGLGDTSSFRIGKKCLNCLLMAVNSYNMEFNKEIENGY